MEQYFRTIFSRLVRLAILAGALTIPGRVYASPPDSFRALIFSKTLLYRHSSIPAGIAAIKTLGAEHGFQVDASEDETVFTTTNLARYKVIIFLSTSGNFLNTEEQAAFRQFIESGGGFAGIHAAIAGREATEGDWPWYCDLCAAQFVNHTSVMPATVVIEDTNNPSTASLPARWTHADEWYFFNVNPRDKVHVLASVEEKKDHPIVWCRDVGKGRMWYTALGHPDEAFSEPLFLQHILGGIEYAAGQKGKLRMPKL